jgi:hypothetical protein
MEHVQWNGSGVVVSTSGQRKSVQFQLDQYQEEVSDGFGGMIPGMKTLLGTIDPPCFVGQRGLVLEMDEGRTVRFFYTDGRGSITCQGAITPVVWRNHEHF